jgi:hypothetical protein
MLGLTDASVARGPSTGIRTGHRRMAPLPYLKEQRVNLAFMGWAADDPDIPAGASWVTPMVHGKASLEALYLAKSDTIDRAIAQGGWRVRPVR